MDTISWIAIDTFLLHWAVVVGLSLRVIMRRRPVGVSLAWIALIASVPLAGALIYLYIGENRISSRYLKRAAAIQDLYEVWKRSLRDHASVEGSALLPEAIPIQRQAASVVGFPAMSGNRLELLRDHVGVFRALIADIDRARSSCHLEFYIWHEGGLADEVLEAVLRAAGRGVVCRVLIDAVGSKAFLRAPAPARLRAGGVQLAAALPVGVLPLSRADLRNHRKVVVIDGRIAYTGSQNLVDPRFFKQDEGVGQWIDAMVRMEGPAVEALAGAFIQDWEIVTGVGLESLEPSHDVDPVPRKGASTVQVVPSGPVSRPLAILQLLLRGIYAARRELIITTPYFVPDESLLTALVSAAHSGVQVTLVVPARNDSRLVHFASRSFYDDLLAAGVRIAGFQGGLLHTKSMTIDGAFCAFGSVNMDMRSLWLNFEMTLFVYDRSFTTELREMQTGYLRDSELLDPQAWRARPTGQRLIESSVHLLSPLL
jgi:cardiolipin synthase